MPTGKATNLLSLGDASCTKTPFDLDFIEGPKGSVLHFWWSPLGPCRDKVSIVQPGFEPADFRPCSCDRQGPRKPRLLHQLAHPSPIGVRITSQIPLVCSEDGYTAGVDVRHIPSEGLMASDAKANTSVSPHDPELDFIGRENAQDPTSVDRPAVQLR